MIASHIKVQNRAQLKFMLFVLMRIAYRDVDSCTRRLC